jgi:hypothetical protein
VGAGRLRWFARVIDNAQFIDLDDPTTRAGVQLLGESGLLDTQDASGAQVDRVAQILDTDPAPDEAAP